jgi:hypothetical protein
MLIVKRKEGFIAPLILAEGGPFATHGTLAVSNELGRRQTIINKHLKQECISRA